MTTPNTGLDNNVRQAVADALNGVLADTYTLYLKTHSYHWNVTGPRFRSLHLMFEEQYREMWAALDEMAERIRSLGVFAPTSSKHMGELASIESAEDTPPPADKMVKNLLDGHETLIRRARKALSVAEDAGDVEMLAKRLGVERLRGGGVDGVAGLDIQHGPSRGVRGSHRAGA